MTARYRIVDEIAHGGMGTVFVGLSTDDAGRVAPVAIKRLHAHLLEDEAANGAFADEARIASKLHHPNLVRVHEITPVDGQLVIVMDWVEGIALSTLVRKRALALPVPVIRRILVDMLEGLHAAHELADEDGQSLGVIHRDISPQNLLVGADGVTRVTDFGIALAKGRLAPMTAEGGVKGKIPYLSPEQVNRTPIDRRSDIFAAGAVAWELLAGRRLFQAASEGEILAMILREPLVPPSSLRLDVPLDLDETVLKALERKAERRFETAADFANAIREGGPLASAEDVGRVVIDKAGTTLAARRQKLALATERPAAPRSLQEEMTATVFVPPPTTRRRTTLVSADRIVITPGSPSTGVTMEAIPTRSTTPALVAGIVALLVAIVVVIGLSSRPSSPEPQKVVFPVAPSIPARPVETVLPLQIELSADPARPPPPKPRRPGGHRSRPDAGRGQQPFMPDDL